MFLFCQSYQIVTISNWVEFNTISGQTKQEYELTTDLDGISQDFSPLNLSGVLDGKGHAISNLYIKKSVNTDSTSLSALFGNVVTGSVVKNLILKNITVRHDLSKESAQLKQISGIVAAMGSLNIVDVQLFSCSIYQIGQQTSRYVGAVIGYQGCGESRFENSSNYNFLVNQKLAVTLRMESFWVGGLVGFSSKDASLTLWNVQTQLVYTNNQPDYQVYVGGVIGKSKNIFNGFMVNSNLTLLLPTQKNGLFGGVTGFSQNITLIDSLIILQGSMKSKLVSVFSPEVSLLADVQKIVVQYDLPTSSYRNLMSNCDGCKLTHIYGYNTQQNNFLDGVIFVKELQKTSKAFYQQLHFDYNWDVYPLQQNKLPFPTFEHPTVCQNSSECIGPPCLNTSDCPITDGCQNLCNYSQEICINNLYCVCDETKNFYSFGDTCIYQECAIVDGVICGNQGICFQGECVCDNQDTCPTPGFPRNCSFCQGCILYPDMVYTCTNYTSCPENYIGVPPNCVFNGDGGLLPCNYCNGDCWHDVTQSIYFCENCEVNFESPQSGCLNCKPGLSGPDCIVCDSCNTSDVCHCGPNGNCYINETTGKPFCTSSTCADGFFDPLSGCIDTCEVGQFGPNCEFCSFPWCNCVNCNGDGCGVYVNGSLYCNGSCQPGFQNPQTGCVEAQCSEGWIGADCKTCFAGNAIWTLKCSTETCFGNCCFENAQTNKFCFGECFEGYDEPETGCQAKNRNKGGFPWWIILIIVILVLALIAGIVAGVLIKKKKDAAKKALQNNSSNNQSYTNTNIGGTSSDGSKTLPDTSANGTDLDKQADNVSQISNLGKDQSTQKLKGIAPVSGKLGKTSKGKASGNSKLGPLGGIDGENNSMKASSSKGSKSSNGKGSKANSGSKTGKGGLAVPQSQSKEINQDGTEVLPSLAVSGKTKLQKLNAVSLGDEGLQQIKPSQFQVPTGTVPPPIKSRSGSKPTGVAKKKKAGEKSKSIKKGGKADTQSAPGLYTEMLKAQQPAKINLEDLDDVDGSDSLVDMNSDFKGANAKQGIVQLTNGQDVNGLQGGQFDRFGHPISGPNVIDSNNGVLQTNGLMSEQVGLGSKGGKIGLMSQEDAFLSDLQASAVPNVKGGKLGVNQQEFVEDDSQLDLADQGRNDAIGSDNLFGDDFGTNQGKGSLEQLNGYNDEYNQGYDQGSGIRLAPIGNALSTVEVAGTGRYNMGKIVNSGTAGYGLDSQTKDVNRYGLNAQLAQSKRAAGLQPVKLSKSKVKKVKKPADIEEQDFV